MNLERRTPLSPGTKRLTTSKPLKATKGLDPGKGFVAPRKPLQARPEPLRGAAPSPRKALPRKAAARAFRPALRSTGPVLVIRALCTARDAGLCVRCGSPATNLHHREGRGMGGRQGADRERVNGPAWLLWLCGMGNTSGCHGWVDQDRATAEAQGYVLRRGHALDAEQVPVLTARGWERFADDGTRTACESPVDDTP